jgi:DNA repair protein RecO
MHEEKQIGMVLKATPYLENQTLLTLFTAEKGLISCLTKRSMQKVSASFSLFSLGEWVYWKGRSSLFFLKESSLIDGHFFLRDNLSRLLAAGKIAEIILFSQLPEKPTPALYALTTFYMRSLKQCPPQKHSFVSFIASFYLKCLHHEGCLHFSNFCSRCKQTSFFLEKGESYCQTHASPKAYELSREEKVLFYKLLNARRMLEIFSLETTLELEQKIFSMIREWLGRPKSNHR